MRRERPAPGWPDVACEASGQRIGRALRNLTTPRVEDG